jgi:ferritin
MLKKNIEKALNAQLNAEAYSAYLYMSMAAWAVEDNLPGFANWMHVQAQEETLHATKFYDFIIGRGGRVELLAIDKPPVEWASPLAMFEAAYAHEQKVTGLINKLTDLAIKESDHATNIFLQWFVTEQVEEEANADQNVRKTKMVGDSQQGLFMLDRELATRVFTPPPAAADAGA